ncbi:MAG: dimethyl sulfoxide reductase anchor subunit [Bacteroidales bacterium]|nr:dimethyl sulfoxide reductase anchor subunit [Bacteroidales bacterium]
MTFSVAKLISALVDGIFPKTPGFFSVIILAGLLSLLHLGKKKRAWKAVLNIRKSPLSREIVLFILYSLLSGATMLYQMPLLLIASSVTGLILLLSIDAVYLFADKRKTVFLHSGQTFITALLMVSFLTGKILPFIFVAAIKLVTILWNMITNRDDNLNFVMRFVRTSMLIITCISMISGISYPENAVIILFLTGELLDRIMFYIDFKPLDINRLIYSHLKEAEK